MGLGECVCNDGGGGERCDSQVHPVESDNCKHYKQICMPLDKPCCKGLSCKPDPLHYVSRCEAKDIYKVSGEKAKEDWGGYSSNEIVKSSRVKQKRQNIGVGHIDGLRSNEREELSFIDGSIEGLDMDRVHQK